MSGANEFLIRHGQSAAQIDAEKHLLLFQKDMEKGLKGQPSPLPMMPSYLSSEIKHKIKEKKLLIDLGGTNLRCAVGWFDDKHKPCFEYLSKYPVPLDNIGAEEFYGYIARCIEPISCLGDDIGLCFSFNVDVDSTLDGVLIGLSKEMDNPDLIGTRVGRRTLEALLRYDGKARKISVLNDTAATLLGGLSLRPNEKFSAAVGFIMGTGTNICYAEDTAKIEKVAGYRQKKMIINCESAEYGGFAQGDFDKSVAENTDFPDQSPLEKMTSGKYLADIAFQALIAAQNEGLLPDSGLHIPFDTIDISEFFTNKQGLLYDAYHAKSDRVTVAEILSGIIERSAKISATTIAAAALFSHDGSDNPVGLVCEGTTYHRLPKYKQLLRYYLDRLLTDKGIKYQIIDDGSEYNLTGGLMSTFAFPEFVR